MAGTSSTSQSTAQMPSPWPGPGYSPRAENRIPERGQPAQGPGTRAVYCCPVSWGFAVSGEGGVLSWGRNPTGCQTGLCWAPGGQVPLRALTCSGQLLGSEEGTWHRDGFPQGEEGRWSPPPTEKQVGMTPAPTRRRPTPTPSSPAVGLAGLCEEWGLCSGADGGDLPCPGSPEVPL